MSDQTFFWRRLRWRFRGAWMWPAFVTGDPGRGSPALAPAARGHRPQPDRGRPAGHLREPGADRRAGALAGPPHGGAAGAREPAETERELLKDRVATGLLVAGVFG